MLFIPKVSALPPRQPKFYLSAKDREKVEDALRIIRESGARMVGVSHEFERPPARSGFELHWFHRNAHWIVRLLLEQIDYLESQRASLSTMDSQERTDGD